MHGAGQSAKPLTQFEAVSFQKKHLYFSGMASCTDSTLGSGEVACTSRFSLGNTYVPV